MMISFMLLFVMSLGFGTGESVEDVWEQMGELPESSEMALSATEISLDYDKLEAMMGDELDMMIAEWPPEDFPPPLQEYSLEELFDLARFEVRGMILTPEEEDWEDPMLFLAVRPLLDETSELLLSILSMFPQDTVDNRPVWLLDDLLISHDKDWFYFANSSDSLLKGLSTPESRLGDLELYADSTADLPGEAKLAAWLDLSQIMEKDESYDDYPDEADNKGNEPDSVEFEDSLTTLALAITEERLILRLGLKDETSLPEDYRRFSGREGYPTLAELVPGNCLVFGDAWLDNPLLYLVEMIASDDEEDESEELEIPEADAAELSSLQTGEMAISLHAVPGEPRNEMVEELLDDTIDLDFERHDPRLMFYFGSEQSAELLTTLTDLLLEVSPDNEPERSNQFFGVLIAEVWGIDDGDIYLIPVDEALVICVGESSAEMFATSYGRTDNLSRDEEFLASKAIPTEPISVSLFLRLEEMIEATTEDDGYPMPNLFQDGMGTMGLTAKLGEDAIEIVGDDELLSLAFSAAFLGFSLPFSEKGNEEAIATSEAKTETEAVEQPE
ncbi:hypothetical protein K8R78_04980 [bacterium]|nr:hypothetical protein [bacterium]